MTTDYWLLRFDDSSAILNALPEGGPRSYLLTRGVPLKDKFPAGYKLEFSKDYPQLRKLFDFVNTPLRTLFVSEKVKKVLESLEATNCEFIPITVLNHKGKPASATPYYVLNVLGSEDAIDMEKSVCVMNPVKEDQVQFFNKLVLKREGISPNALIFRARRKMDEILLSQKLHEAFLREGLTGYTLIAADGWDGMEF